MALLTLGAALDKRAPLAKHRAPCNAPARTNTSSVPAGSSLGDAEPTTSGVWAGFIRYGDAPGGTEALPGTRCGATGSAAGVTTLVRRRRLRPNEDARTPSTV
jgi:hypothetical protein